MQVAVAIRSMTNGAQFCVLVAMSGDEELLAAAERSGHFRSTFRKPIDFGRLLGVLQRGLAVERRV